MGGFDGHSAQGPDLANCEGFHRAPRSGDRHRAATLQGALGLSTLCPLVPVPNRKETSGTGARRAARTASGGPLEISAASFVHGSPACPRVHARTAGRSLQTVPHLGDAAPLRVQVSREPPDWKAAPGPGSRAGRGPRADRGGARAARGAVRRGRWAVRDGCGGSRGRRAAGSPRRPRPAPPARGPRSARAARGAGSGGKSRTKERRCRRRLASSLAGLAAEVSGWAGGQGRADARPARGPRRGARPGLAWPGFGGGGGAARAPRGAGVRPVRVSERGARTCGAGWWRGSVCTPRAAVGCVRYSALLRDRVPAARAEFLSGSPRCSWTEAGAGRCGRRGRE